MPPCPLSPPLVTQMSEEKNPYQAPQTIEDRVKLGSMVSGIIAAFFVLTMSISGLTFFLSLALRTTGIK